jgi:integrase
MSISEKFSVTRYIPAQLHENKRWYITYYVVDPATNKLKQKVIKVNRVKSITERRKWARQLMHELNIKLAGGWNPYLEQEASKGFCKLFDVLNTFQVTKEKELRPDSIRSYNSYIKILKDYVTEKIKGKNIYVNTFDKSYAINFMQYMYLNKNISERYYNNNVKFYRTFFNWCIQYNYCSVNPFAGISMKKEKQKKRIMIDQDTKDRLRIYLEEHNPEYFVICMLAHYTLLRPKEITYLKIKDVEVENQRIFTPGSIAKNCKDRYSTIPDVVIDYIRRLELDKYDKEYFLFSEKFRPGKNKIDPRVIAKYWEKLRREVGMPQEMQFYSLRDSGIVQMIHDNIPIDEIRDQADHSSLEITNIYTKFAKITISQEIKKKCKEF